MYDAIIVGARCAGSATALLLARAGYRVLVVDRTSFPSDTLSSHAIRIPGVARLRRWGVLDAVSASNCPPLRAVRLDVGPFALQGTAHPYEGADSMYAPRRYVVDAILADAAIRAGAELRERFTVTGLLTEGDRVVGIRGASATGMPVSERARIVIGADGQRSLVARLAGAGAYDDYPALTCNYYSYFEDLQLEADVELYPREGAFVVTNRTNDGLASVNVVRPRADFDLLRHDVEREFYATAEAASPSLGERLRAARRVERWYGTGDLPFFFRAAHGPGWALVGDASCHKDPILAHGMSDAFRGAELLGQALDDAFSERSPLEVALAKYEHARYTAAKPLYELAHQFAALAAPPPEAQATFAALHGDQVQTDRFLSALEGTVPVEEFFAPPFAHAV